MGAVPDQGSAPIYIQGVGAVEPSGWGIGLSDPLGQDTSLVVDDLTGACHGTGTAGQTLVGENKGAIFRYLNSTGGAGFFTQATADAGDIAHMETTGIFIGAEDDNGIGLYTEVDDTLGAGAVTGTATDAFALVNLGDTVGIDIDGAESAHIDTSTATGTAVMTQVGTVFLLLCTATAVAVDTSDLLGEFFLNDHGEPPYRRS